MGDLTNKMSNGIVWHLQWWGGFFCGVGVGITVMILRG
jgi:hypothetical protein